MPSIIRSDVAETCLRRLLAKEGDELNRPKRNGQTGVDIMATKGAERLAADGATCCFSEHVIHARVEDEGGPTLA
jgi:hypothetical protein